MIDTVTLNFSEFIRPDVYKSWNERKDRNPSGGMRYQYHTSVELENGAPVKYSYFPYSDHGNPILKLEFSIPHFIYGNNIQMISKIETAMDLANDALPSIDGIPKLDLWEGG